MVNFLRAFTLIFALFAYGAAAAQIYFDDPTFQTLQVKQSRASVQSIIMQPDQKILMNGQMHFVNDKPAEGTIRLNADGSLDTTFITPIDAKYTQLLALRKDGKILTGLFSINSANERTTKILLLKSDGSLDSTFETNVRNDYPVPDAFLVQKDNKILLGANAFDNGSVKSGLYRLHPDGSLDNDFSVNMESAPVEIKWVISALLQQDGKIVLLGDMKNKNTGRPVFLIRINADGSLDNTFDCAFFGQPFAVQLQNDGKILLGRNGFSTDTGIIRLNPDGSLDNTFHASTQDVPYSVYSIALQADGKIVMGELSSNPEGGIYDINQIVRLNMDGSLDAAFSSGKGAELAVEALAVQTDGNIVAGGTFSTFNGNLQPGIVRLNKSSGAVDVAFKCKMESSGYINKVARQADGKLLVGGIFHTANNKVSRHIARILADGSIDNTFNIGTGADALGDFTEGQITAFAIEADNKILVGGTFTSFNGQQTTALIRLNPDGSLHTKLQLPDSDGVHISNIALQPDGKILISKHTHMEAQSYLIRLNADGSEDVSFNTGTGFDFGIKYLLLQTDGKIIVSGDFTSYNGTPANHILRLNADGTADKTFKDDQLDEQWYSHYNIRSIQLQKDDKILIAGLFTQFNAKSANHIVRLNTDGSLDDTFTSGLSADNRINDISLQPDGRLLLTGYFASAGNHVVYLNPDGSLDKSFFMVMGLNKPYYNKVWVEGENLFALSPDQLQRFSRTLSQTITFEAIPDKYVNDTSFTVNATSSSGLAVTLSLVSGPATMAGNTITLTKQPGTVIIRASQKGNELYKPAPEVEKRVEVWAVLGLEGIEDKVSVYPNPAMGKLLVMLPSGYYIEEANMYSASGIPVQVFLTSSSPGYGVEPQNTGPGLYLLHLETNQGKIIKRIIIK